MRLLLISMLMMGGVMLVMTLALAQTAKLGKDVSESVSIEEFEPGIAPATLAMIHRIEAEHAAPGKDIRSVLLDPATRRWAWSLVRLALGPLGR